MNLTLESGRVIHDPTEPDIVVSIESEGFAILGGDNTFIQCAKDSKDTGGNDLYTLEYQEEPLDSHYRAVDEPITLDRVRSAFIKYARGDESWHSDFLWEKMEVRDHARTTLEDIKDAIGEIDLDLSDISSKLSEISENTSDLGTFLRNQFNETPFLTLILFGILVVLIVHVLHHW
jgi:hypothetical protein